MHFKVWKYLLPVVHPCGHKRILYLKWILLIPKGKLLWTGCTQGSVSCPRTLGNKILTLQSHSLLEGWCSLTRNRSLTTAVTAINPKHYSNREMIVDGWAPHFKSKYEYSAVQQTTVTCLCLWRTFKLQLVFSLTIYDWRKINLMFLSADTQTVSALQTCKGYFLTSFCCFLGKI